MKTNYMGLLGILGGLGPLSSSYFYEVITKHTYAKCDQDHIDILLSSHSATPDRTDYILGKSKRSPVPYMIADAQMLENCGANAIVIPCNTAHYFINEVRKSVNVPVPSIIEETVLHLKNLGKVKPLVLATEGTICTKSYQISLAEHGIDYLIPCESDQKVINYAIYEGVKSGDLSVVEEIADLIGSSLYRDCDCVILGCTELSVLKPQLKVEVDIVDSIECLASSVIKMFGKKVVGLF